MAETRRDRRAKTRGPGNSRSSRSGVLLGIAGALIAALLVYQVFLKGDDTPTAAPAGRPAVAAVAGDGTTTTTVPLEPELPNGSFDELSLRDPFEPVGQISDGGETTPTTPPDTTDDTTDTIPTTPTTSPAQNPAASTEVALLDVTNVNGVLTARVRVGGAEYTVVAGQTFGPENNYVLVTFTSDSCANFTYADSPFSLCTGEQVLK
jgi:hypothetical protein